MQFVLNYEEGGENCILHGDAASEAFLSEIVGAQAWPGQRHMNMESIYEFGSRAGFWRLWRLFTERGMPLTVYAVAMAMARNPEAVAAMNEAGWEIASHGLKWIDYKDFAREDERQHILEAIRIHTETAGSRPLGMYQGRTSVNTLDLVMEEQGFLYSADSYADELPYWVSGPHGPQLIVPYTLDANDMRFATPQGFNAGDQFFAYLKDSFDVLYAEGKAGAAEDDVGRPALPPGRAPRTRGGARPLPRLCAEPRSGVGRHPPGHRAPLDCDASAGRRLRTVAHAESVVRRAVRHGDAASLIAVRSVRWQMPTLSAARCIQNGQYGSFASDPSMLRCATSHERMSVRI